MIYGTILCLGDSIVYGARDELGRGFPVELQLMLKEAYPDQVWNCVNRGVNSWTSVDLARNVYDLVRSYPEAYEVVVCVGMNDSKPLSRVSASMFSVHLEIVLDTMKVFNKFVYLCTVPRLGCFGSPDYDRSCMEVIKGYNEVIIKYSLSSMVCLVNLNGLSDDSYADTVHLNNAGYREVADILFSNIKLRRDPFIVFEELLDV